MKRQTYVVLLLTSLLTALLLSGLSLLALNRFSEQATSGFRREFLLLYVAELEKRIEGLGLAELALRRADDIFVPPRMSLHPPAPAQLSPHAHIRPPFLRSPPGFKPEFWLANASGEIVVSSTQTQLPIEWATFEVPKTPGEIFTSSDFLRIKRNVLVVKLNRDPALFLVAVEPRNPFQGATLVTQAVLTFATVGGSLFLSLTLTFLYLRRKSQEARAVLLKLEQGDLKARFEIQKFDEFGGLLLAFNRMADEIEKLVGRVRATESARKNLLQELGHDLRTPLTSLATAFETLKVHFRKMSDQEREELFSMATAEVAYFKELLEKLMTIASLDEPNFKRSTEVIDLQKLVAHEVKNRQGQSVKQLNWTLACDLQERPLVLGDAHLLLRLFKNAFENANRYAKASVTISIRLQAARVLVRIVDDGPGLSAEELRLFGKRREQRSVLNSEHLNFSLGLGSVIMCAIAELHDGQVQITNASSTGACLTIELPLVKEARLK